MAQQVQFNISDALEAKIVERWVDIATWKDWVKTTTRKEWQDTKVKNLHLAAASKLATDVAVIEAIPD